MSKRIIYLSDLDLSGSGYLNITTPLCTGLAKLGYEIKVLGLGYRGTQHDYPFSIIPTANLQEVFAMLQNLYQAWKFDCFVVALDIPIQIHLLQRMRNRPFKYVGIMPVEADPLCMSWAAQLTQMDKAVIISKFGFEEAQKAGVFNASYLQVGVDTELWKPPTSDERKRVRSILGFEEDTFAVLTIADNQERKNLSRSMEIFSDFAKDKPNAKYILVTRKGSPVGWNLDDLAIDLDIMNKMLMFERGIDFKQLWSLYAASDCFLLCSKTEGLGMPILEAMSCFTETTNIVANNVLGGIERSYSGELISITTDRCTIDVTPEHPIWTSDGWQYARDINVGSLLWYNDPKSYILGELNAKERIPTLYQGRIGDVVRTIQNNDSRTNSRENGKNSQFYRMANTSGRNKEEYRINNFFSRCKTLARKIGLFSGDNRWGGNSYNSEDGGTTSNKMETNNSNSQHSKIFIGLVRRKFELSFNLGKLAIQSFISRCRSMFHIFYFWNLSSSSIQISYTVFGDKTRFDRDDNRVLRIENESIKSRPLYRIPDEHYLQSSRAKFEAVQKVYKRNVNEISVYNLRTEDGCYLAEGYLVHNCGLPCIGTDCTGIKESLEDNRGKLIKYDYTHIDPFGNQHRYWANLEDGVFALEKIYKKISPPDIVMARKYVEDRKWEISVDQLDKVLKEVIGEQA